MYAVIRTGGKQYRVEPGDTILAPSTVEAKYRSLPLWRDIATIFGQFALTVASIATLFR